MQKRCVFEFLAVAASFCGVAVAADTPFQCFANGGVCTPNRSEGLGEFAGDFVVNCLGGIPTSPGSPIPAVDIQISLNTSLTSRLLADPWSEALLLIDEPL